jgi:predicted dehydrogenase
MPITVAIVGGGMFGAKHVDCFRGDPRARVKWMGVRSDASLAEWSRDPRVERATRRLEEILGDPEVDAVVVATPPGSHAELALAVLRAGKHLLLEKPLAATRAQAAAVVEEAARRPGQVVLEASCRHARLTPKFPLVKGLVDSGRLGTIYHLHHVMLTPDTFLDWNPRGRWALSRAEAGGGPLFDWGEYDLSFLLGILGDAPALRAVAAFQRGGLRTVAGDVEQHAAAFLTFDGGLTLAYERGAGVHGRAGLETRIHGTRGGLRLSYLTWESPELELFCEGPDGRPVREVLTVDMSGHRFDDNVPLVAHFLDCVEGKATPAMPVDLAYKHLDVILRMLEAGAPHPEGAGPRALT